MVETKSREEITADQCFKLLSKQENARFKATDDLIMITFDDNYVDLSMNLILSVARQHPEGVSFICICPRLKQDNIDRVLSLGQGIQLRCYEFAQAVDTGNLPACAVFRLFCPWLLEEGFHKILYLDPDILCSGSLSELFSMNVECIGLCSEICGNVCQMHQDTIRLICPTQIYCNAGVVLFNLHYIRAHYTFGQLLDALLDLQQKVAFLDQDFLNVFYKGKIEYINGFHYNFQAYELRKTPFYNQALANCRLIHFSDGKPWNYTTSLQLIRLYLSYSEHPVMIERCKKAAVKRCFYLPAAAFLKVYRKLFKRY